MPPITSGATGYLTYGTIAAIGTFPHDAAVIVIPAFVGLLYRHYNGKPALFDRHYIEASTILPLTIGYSGA